MKFVDPRILVPCFRTLCINCIHALTNYTNEISCHFCQIKHKIPNGRHGFESNKIVAQIVTLKAACDLSSSVKLLEQKLDRIHIQTDNLKIDKSKLFLLREHCSQVKNQIILQVNTKKKMMEELRDEYVEEIVKQQMCYPDCGRKEIRPFENGQTLRHTLQHILNLTNQFKFKNQTFPQLIYQHCSKLKDQISLLVDTKMKVIDDLKDEFFNKIDTYEDDCEKKWQKLTDRFEEIRKLAQIWKEYLKSARIDEKIVNENNQQADEFLIDLEKLVQDHKCAQFQTELLKFKANESKTEAIGVLQFLKPEDLG
jgi:hypothetical protein